MIALPPNVSELNDFMCGHFNREGQLCGDCKKGYGPALFTNYECAKCSTKNYGWALYLLLEFLPNVFKKLPLETRKLPLSV